MGFSVVLWLKHAQRCTLSAAFSVFVPAHGKTNATQQFDFVCRLVEREPIKPAVKAQAMWQTAVVLESVTYGETQALGRIVSYALLHLLRCRVLIKREALGRQIAVLL